MTVFLILFAAIFGAFCLLSQRTSSDLISTQLSDVEKSYVTSNDIFIKNSLIVIINRDGSYLVQNGENYFSHDIINGLVHKSETLSSGVIGTVYYSTSDIESGTILVALDMDKHLQSVSAMKIQVLLCLLVFYVIIFLIVMASSSKIFLPVQQTLFRQRQFISDAGHELKTPVTIISANTDVLKKISDNKYLDSIKTQTERLEFLINDMLTLAKLDEDKFKRNKERFSVSDAVKESALPFEEVAFDKGKFLSFDIAENIEYFGDRSSLIKILEILLDNAIKYSSKGGNIFLTLANVNGTITITVSNTGSEIREEETEKIFDRFFRGDDSRSRELGGSGLGLSIAKSYCALNKWKIYATSVYKKSMTITVKL